MEKDSVYLKHILDAIIAIEGYIEKVDFADFQEHKNKLTQDGVMRELEIIGEAAKSLSAEFKSSYSEIPWKDIMSMRDRLIHEYFGVDLKVVWETVQEDLPKLKAQIEGILSKES